MISLSNKEQELLKLLEKKYNLPSVPDVWNEDIADEYREAAIAYEVSAVQSNREDDLLLDIIHLGDKLYDHFLNVKE
ncbi:hypothetical protein [Globicatella sulfidifaciens]|uniref:Uncharacterized protein n=1 Tax=Globicatella sulfidifaciens TaxID=136093 RepID=A0A7X8C5G0_9LACT|nr:hypothetical protein [Globicatella sulfidifaciens]NLJ19323.1 hypothetical protein [Globicatella sulfidifaciens]